MRELVSICVPVFNGAKYIGETLESLVRQTYEYLEIVVSDNASDDGTVQIIKSFASQDPRIRLLTSERNMGYCANIKKAVGFAKGGIVCIFHADDIYEKDIVSKQYYVLRNNFEVSAVFSRSDSFSGSVLNAEPNAVFDLLKKTPLYSRKRNIFIGKLDEYAPAILEYGNFLACPSFMTYKDVYFELGGYTDQYPSNEDLDLWIRYLKNGRGICIVNECLIHYRRSNTHASAYWAKQLQIPVEFSVVEEQLLHNYRFSPVELRKYHKRKAGSIVGKAVLAIKNGDNDKAAELLALSKREYRLPPFTKLGLLQLSARLDAIIFKLLIAARRTIAVDA